jgi:hypothetical protein
MPLINYIGNRQECLDGRQGFVRGDAPGPPNLEVEYLIVAGGTGGAAGTGGSAGGVLSGSLSIPFRSTTTMNVGSGGLSNTFQSGQSSSISHPTLGFIGIAGGNYGGNSGNNFSNGLGGPEGSGGGGAGSSQDGQSGVEDVSGNGGNGSQWVNGLYYGGGGGGTGDPDRPSVPGLGGLGGGGTAQFPGTTPDDLPYQLNGYNGRGAGAAGASNTKGGDGVVIIRYSTASVVPPYDNAITGGDLLISGGYVYRSFTTGSSQLVYSY